MTSACSRCALVIPSTERTHKGSKKSSPPPGKDSQDLPQREDLLSSNLRGIFIRVHPFQFLRAPPSFLPRSEIRHISSLIYSGFSFPLSCWGPILSVVPILLPANPRSRSYFISSAPPCSLGTHTFTQEIFSIIIKCKYPLVGLVFSTARKRMCCMHTELSLLRKTL